jgi:hypothetical protein
MVFGTIAYILDSFQLDTCKDVKIAKGILREKQDAQKRKSSKKARLDKVERSSENK